MRSFFAAIATVVLVLGVSTEAVADTMLLANGGFETGDFSYWNVNDPSFGTFVSGASAPYLPHSGEYFAALGASGVLGSISQTLNTTPEQKYVLTLFLASDGSIPNQFEVQWGGSTIMNQLDISAQGYTEYTFLVSATSSSTTLTFLERNDNGFLSLDDVSVTPAAPPASVPAPASILLSLIGLATIGVRQVASRATQPTNGQDTMCCVSGGRAEMAAHAPDLRQDDTPHHS
jgi:hypothetical protein